MPLNPGALRLRKDRESRYNSTSLAWLVLLRPSTLRTSLSFTKTEPWLRESPNPATSQDVRPEPSADASRGILTTEQQRAGRRSSHMRRSLSTRMVLDRVWVGADPAHRTPPTGLSLHLLFPFLLSFCFFLTFSLAGSFSLAQNWRKTST